MAAQRICISIDPKLLEEVYEISVKEERSISKQIVHMIKQAKVKKECLTK